MSDVMPRTIAEACHIVNKNACPYCLPIVGEKLAIRCAENQELNNRVTTKG